MADELLEKTWFETVLYEYEQGSSDVEVCQVMKTTLPKFRALYEKDPSFKQLVDYGRTVSEAWWLRQARTQLTLKGFNTSLWYAVMKNRYGWSDKTEMINGIPDELTNLDAIRAKILEKMPEFAKLVGAETVKDGDLLRLVK